MFPSAGWKSLSRSRPLREYSQYTTHSRRPQARDSLPGFGCGCSSKGCEIRCVKLDKRRKRARLVSGKKTVHRVILSGGGLRLDRRSRRTPTSGRESARIPYRGPSTPRSLRDLVAQDDKLEMRAQAALLMTMRNRVSHESRLRFSNHYPLPTIHFIMKS